MALPRTLREPDVPLEKTTEMGKASQAEGKLAVQLLARAVEQAAGELQGPHMQDRPGVYKDLSVPDRAG